MSDWLREEFERDFPSWPHDGPRLLKELPGWDVNDLTLLQLQYIRRARGKGTYNALNFAMKDGVLLIQLNDDANPPGWYLEKFDHIDSDREKLLEYATAEKARRFDLLGER